MSQQDGASSPIRLVVVEDEEIILLSLIGTLTRMGYEIVGTATSGVDALAQIESNRPDVLLLDLRLSGSMDGLEVARRVRAFSDTPIVFTTAHALSLARAISEIPGSCATVGKPFTPSQLHTAIQSVWKNSKAGTL